MPAPLNPQNNFNNRAQMNPSQVQPPAARRASSVAPTPEMEPASPLTPSRRALLLIAVVVVLAVLGGGVYWWYTQRSDAASGATSSNVSGGNTSSAVATTDTPVTTVSDPAVEAPTLIENDGDADNDGLSDEEETKQGTDPNNQDTDGDKLNDWEEVTVYQTDPQKKDTDGDGFSDGEEVLSQHNPNGSGDLRDFAAALEQFDSQNSQ